MKSGQLTSAKLSATERVRVATLQLVMDEHRIRVGENIRARREELGWSVPTTARKLPVADKTLERWERGETFGHMSNLEKLADVLQTTVAALMAVPDDEVETAETPDLMPSLNGGSAAEPPYVKELRTELQAVKEMLTDLSRQIEGSTEAVGTRIEESETKLSRLLRAPGRVRRQAG